MQPNPSNVLLNEHLQLLNSRQPARKRFLRPCSLGFPHKVILSLGLSNRETIGRCYEVCCTPRGDNRCCIFHGAPALCQFSCEALADMFAYIASLEVAPWGDEAFVDFACASTIAFNHRAAQARIDPPNALQRHWLACQRAFPPYVDLPSYRPTVPFVDPPLMVTPVTFAGLLSEPLPRKTGLLLPCDHRVKVRVALYQINNYEASLLDCVGIKRGEIVEFTLRQTGIFKELGIQDTNRRVLASLQIYLPAQGMWSRAPRPSDKLHLSIGEGVIYRLPHVGRTPDLGQIIQQIIPRALVGRGPPLPAVPVYPGQPEQANNVPPAAPASMPVLATPVSTIAPAAANSGPAANSVFADDSAFASALMSALIMSAAESTVGFGPEPAEGLSCSSFKIRKNGRLERASALLPISMAHRGRCLSAPLSAPVAGVNGSTARGRRRASSARVARSNAVITLSDDIIEIADDIDNKTARFWQHYLKGGPSARCFRAEGTQVDPIDLTDVGSVFDKDEDAL